MKIRIIHEYIAGNVDSSKGLHFNQQDSKKFDGI